MIKPEVGDLSVLQALSAGAAISTNVIDLQALNYAGITDLWVVVDTAVIAAGDAADTFEFGLVVSAAEALTAPLEIVSVAITDIADVRLATIGRHIMALNIGKMIRDIATSTYRYLGFAYTLSSGATVTVNAMISNSEPPSLYHAQVCTSNVGLPA
ncbi:MAG: hypothetical protein WCY05_03685 [Candidatus Omnitrophota bacterium]